MSSFSKVCKNCSKEFKARSSFYLHKKSCININDNTNKENFLCLDERCKFVCQMKNDFIKHLKDIHSIQCDDEFKTFQSYAEFENWKDMFEKSNKSTYILHYTKKNSSGKVKYYACNRSGKHKCTASIKVQLNDDCTVDAQIFPRHYGHNKELANLKTRVSKSNGNEEQIAPNFLCMEENCTFVCHLKTDFINHLKDLHLISCEDETKTFQNYAEFEEWKENFEKSTTSYYILRSNKKTSTGILKYYICNRSGSYSSKATGKRAIKSQGSEKIGHKCTASIKVQLHEESSSVEALICPMHYGHDNDLAHLRISKSDRMLIANQLSLGIDPRRVIRNMFLMFPDELERKHLATKQDLKNISRAFGIEKFEKHFENSIFLFKRQGESSLCRPKDHQCDLAIDDFVLGIMTHFQKEMLIKLGSNIVCLDATHEENSYEFKIITLLVSDEFREAMPVAWFLSNQDNYASLYLFFTLIKNQIGALNPIIIMTNQTQQYHSAFVDVFKVDPEKLLCHWYVRKDWQKNLNKVTEKEISLNIYKNLCLMLEESSEETFNILLEKFLIKLCNDENTEAFADYFKVYWLPIKEEWAKCYRIRSEINTNMRIESFHKTLKYSEGSLKGKQDKQLDNCLSVLLQFAKDMQIQRLVKLEKGKDTWKSAIDNTNIAAIDKCHKLSLNLPLSLVINISNDTWQVFSEESLHSARSADEAIYEVKKQPECQNDCQIQCDECNICLHSYTCTCPDAQSMTNICKHIHLVVRSLGEIIEYGQNNVHYAENEIILETSIPIQMEIIKDADISQNCAPIITEVAVDNLNPICNEVASDKITDLTILKSRLISKVMNLCKIVKKCDNKELLLTARTHINNATSVLKLKNVEKCSFKKKKLKSSKASSQRSKK